MSQVAISGNASGTGTLTIAAPNTNSNYTLTLPQTTSTLGFDGPAFSAYANANQSITSGVATKITLNAENFDTASAFDSTTNYRFTPTVAGYYQINCTFRCSGTSLTSAFANLYKNGSIYVRICEATTQQITILGSIVVYLDGSTDYLEVYGVVNATSPSFDTAGVATGLYGCRMSGCLVRSA
jgi:hypothetical protein